MVALLRSDCRERLGRQFVRLATRATKRRDGELMTMPAKKDVVIRVKNRVRVGVEGGNGASVTSCSEKSTRDLVWRMVL